ncbi:hypothetical protein [Methanosarcina siciliae]|uniref:hypothetical protein n=1 Tax=Methanosarcina siciliae TaxID=38027 RepID=UPI000A50BF56|nr:hypothetical protein [Methanosarcina siciliae]
MLRKNNSQEPIFEFDDSTNFLAIPDSLIAYTREIVFQTWQIIENQLAKIEPKNDPKMYNALDDRAACLFEAWLTFRYMGDRGV